MTKVITKQHHSLVKQFLDYKHRSQKILTENAKLKKEIAFLELAYVQKTPVMEAEYALDQRTALSLYDCLTPMLKEHRRFKIIIEDKFSVNDFKTQQKLRQLERELEKRSMPRLLEENAKLNARVKQQENELEVVNWYIEILEEGVNTKQLVQEYTKLKKDHR